jgi:putative ABC transport system permease protein
MKGMVLKMALRNVLEHRRKSLTVGIIVAAAAFLFTLGFSILDTASAGIRKEYRNRVTGDLYITARTPKPLTVFGWKDMNEMGTEVPRLPSHAAIKAFADSLPGVESSASRAVGFAQITSDKDAGKLGFGLIMGVETATYAKAFPDALRLASGAPWSGGGGGLVVSDMASSSLGGSLAAPGSTLTLSTMGMSSAIVESRVVGKLAAEDANPFMGMLSYVDIDTLRPLLGYYLNDGHAQPSEAPEAAPQSEEDLFSGDAVSAGKASDADLTSLVRAIGATRPVLQPDPDAWQYIVVKVRNGASVASVRSSIEGFIASESIDATVYDWRGGAGTIASTVLSIKAIFSYIAVLIGLVSLLIIMNALVISVTERTAEIGTMRAIGGTRKFVKGLIVSETVILSSAAGLAGVLLGAGSIGLMSAVGLRTTNFILRILFGGDLFRPLLSLSGCSVTIIAVLAIGVIASLYPTMVALRVPPSVAMQRD